ncbi:Amino acid transporter, transmembrane [Cynara cardunculus var. scolymus]|uniref:Amino acid transporter, transmembrane n=1 Tax=Cynara cardunculus var. scolymus TaxID=59895 RepID=A0A103Y4X1_CYNCS|nr:Amino acid transporter, transmembrane [Cynara cardunculus var. scolymus]
MFFPLLIASIQIDWFLEFQKLSIWENANFNRNCFEFSLRRLCSKKSKSDYRMTIEIRNPSNENRSRNRKQVIVDDKVPLLPTKKEEDGGLEEFDGASFTGAVFNLSTTIVGAGIMALPATMKVLGLIPGIALIIIMAFLTESSIDLLIRFSRARKSVSYGGLMEDEFGKVGRILLQVCVLVNNIGVLVVYMIIIGDVLSGINSNGIHHAGVLQEWFGEHWWNGRFFILLVTTLFVFAPLAGLKRIDSLRYTSALSMALAVVFLVIIAGITIFKLMIGSIMMPRLFPQVVDFASIKAVVRASLILCSTVYIMTSLFGFLLFGDGTLDDVLTNFDTDLGVPYSLLLNDIVRVSYAAHLILVFPIVFFPLRLNMDGLLFPNKRPLILDNMRFASVTIGLMVLVFLGANFIPSIWVAFEFTGATAAVCIGFIFPSAITLRDCYGIASKKDKILCVFMIALAAFSNLMAVYSNASALLSNNGSPPE